MSATKRPAKTYRAKRGLSVSIWENQAEGKDGSFIYYTFVLEKRYKDPQGHWQSSRSFRERDIPLIQSLVTRAGDYVGRVREDGQADDTGFDPEQLEGQER